MQLWISRSFFIHYYLAFGVRIDGIVGTLGMEHAKLECLMKLSLLVISVFSSDSFDYFFFPIFFSAFTATIASREFVDFLILSLSLFVCQNILEKDKFQFPKVTSVPW